VSNSVSGDLNAADTNNVQDGFRVILAGANTANNYGTYAVDAHGVWTYTLDNANPAVGALTTGQTLTDSFTVLSKDGTAQTVDIVIRTNEAPAVVEPAPLAGFAETIVDPAGPDLLVPNSGYWFVVDFDGPDGARAEAIARGGAYGLVLKAEDTPVNGVVVNINPNNDDWGVSALSYSAGVETMRDTSEFTYAGYAGATSTAFPGTLSFLDAGSGIDVRWAGTDIATPDGLFSFAVDITGAAFTDVAPGDMTVNGVSAEAFPDADAGQIGFTDPDSGDSHTATVTGVTVTGDAGLLNGADAFDFLNLQPVDQGTDTVDWDFQMPNTVIADVLAGLSDGEVLTFGYNVEIADTLGGSDVAHLTISLNDDGLFV
jgi:VCBS repeat-containing protein